MHIVHQNLKKDLLRRDFTINTICIDKDGNYIDLLGAKEDIDKKIIIFVFLNVFPSSYKALFWMNRNSYPSPSQFALTTQLKAIMQ